MSSLPVNFSGPPGEELHRSFRNICVEFQKTIKSSKDILELDQQIDSFIDISKQMDWHHKNSGVYHKDPGAKACDRVCSEYMRYRTLLQKDEINANPQDLVDALVQVEQLIRGLKAT